ncbi:hypothetical protein WJX75_005118 [Coccomyxa subellipsoidea]|uniref:SAP domain-containing protein n=1 Tax=Coccomyxa subellipsoidea TaxID=248742 RepID=A0ABR2YL79_9CHLO
MGVRITAYRSGLCSGSLLKLPSVYAALRLGPQEYSTDVSQEQDALVWPPPNHAVEENPALQQLLQAQQARNKREQEQRAAERVQNLRVDLRPILAQLGLKTSGLKPLLIDRLWSAILDEGSVGKSAAKPRWEDDDLVLGEDSIAQPYAQVVTGEEVAQMLRDAKTDDVRVLDVRKRDCDFTDEFVIATARSKLHAQTAAQAIVYQLKQRCKEVAPGIVPTVEGLGTDSSANAQWLVVDCGSVVAHVFEHGDARGEYDLDSMWGGETRSLGAA